MTTGGGRRRRQWKICVDTCMSWLKWQNSANITKKKKKKKKKMGE